MRYCGRDFTEKEIEWIRRQITETNVHRSGLSKKFCEEFSWRKRDGGLKDMSCRVAFLRLEKDGIIKLPPRQRSFGIVRKRVKRTLFTLPGPDIKKPVSVLKVEFEIVTKGNSKLWNEFIDVYHYLGYKPLPGAQMRYFIKSDDEILALLGFGASAWSMASRDKYIGWNASTRKRNLHLIVNNARFLILPWVKCKNLASHILSKASRRLPSDWERRYNYRPVLLESCVEKDRFRGTCYNAANWIYVGETKGRGKLDRYNKAKLPIKKVWLYPLCRKYLTYLLGTDK